MLHRKLIRGVRGTPLAYVVWCHVKVAHISSGHSAYMNLDEEMITRAPIVNSKTNLKLNQESLDRIYLNHQCCTFKTDNALVYQILLKVLMDTDNYVYIKQRKGLQDCQAVFFDVHKQYIIPYHRSGRPHKQKKVAKLSL